MQKLRIENLKVSYQNKKKTVVALNGLSLAAEAGDFLVLLGPSGCGKTTLLKTIAGLVYYDEGEIHINGVNADLLSVKERNLAFLPQNLSLYPHLTVYENIALPLKAAKVPLEELMRRVEEVAKELQIDFLLSRKPRQLSGGQQQRVALARCIVKRPEMYLFDEPFSNLDPPLRAAMRTELKKIHRLLRGTFIFATHDLTEALALATKLAIMTPDGRIAQCGEPLEVLHHPADDYVRDFLGGFKDA